jgi:hypothetical protein
MSRVHPNRRLNPKSGPHFAIFGMTVDDARRHLDGHGLTLVVTRRDGADVSEADLTARGAVWVSVAGGKVASVDGRT